MLCDTPLHAMLEELSDMEIMFFLITIVDDDVIQNAAVTTQARECLIHLTIVMFRNEHSLQLTFITGGMYPFSASSFVKIFVCSAAMLASLCWSIGLISLPPDIPVQILGEYATLMQLSRICESLYVLDCSNAGSLPAGCMTDLLTALGVTVEGSRLSGCSEGIRNSDVPAIDIAAPESGGTSVVSGQSRQEKFSVIVCANSKPACGTREALKACRLGYPYKQPWLHNGGGGGGGGCELLDCPLHALARWPISLQKLRTAAMAAGHC